MSINYGYGIKLTPLQGGDMGQTFGWRNHPDIRKWCRQYTTLEWADHMSWFESLRSISDKKMFGIKAVDPKYELVGVCGLTSIDKHNRKAEFSLYIGPEYHRKGYARAALSTLLMHGFKDLNLNIIWGETFDGNPAEKLFISLGMVKEGTQRSRYFRSGQYIDTHLYSVLSTEWLNTPQTPDVVES